MGAEWGALIDEILGIVGLVGSAFVGTELGNKQAGLGRDMRKEGAELSERFPRPDMDTPEAYQSMMRMAKGRMHQRMPGAQEYENQINESTASGLNALKEMGTGAEAYGGVAELYGKSMGLNRDLKIDEARYRDEAKLGYMGALEGLGNWQRQSWQWNEAEPYLVAQEKAAMLDTMGRTAEWEGLKTKYGVVAESWAGLGSSDMGSSIAGMM